MVESMMLAQYLGAVVFVTVTSSEKGVGVAKTWYVGGGYLP